MPVVDMFEKDGRVVKVDATHGPEKVYEDVQKQFKERGLHKSNE